MLYIFEIYKSNPRRVVNNFTQFRKNAYLSRPIRSSDENRTSDSSATVRRSPLVPSSRHVSRIFIYPLLVNPNRSELIVVTESYKETNEQKFLPLLTQSFIKSSVFDESGAPDSRNKLLIKVKYVADFDFCLSNSTHKN